MARARVASLACVLLLSLSTAGRAQGTATIAIRVMAPDGTPLRSAHVQARSGPLLYEALSDGNGETVFSTPAGDWTIAASKAGFLRYELGERRPLGGGVPVPITSGERRDVELRLSPASVITGIVFDDYGDPVAGATVQAFGSRMRGGRRRLTQPVSSDRTDDTGAFRLHSLPPGDYYVAAALRTRSLDEPGTAAALSTYYPGTTDMTAARLVSLSSGELRGGISFTLLSLRPVRVSGVVTDSTGKPARDASLELLRAGDLEVIARPFGNFGLVQSDGSFTMINVPPGRYVLHARADRPGAGQETAFVPVTVGIDGLAGIGMRTQPGATIEGTIVSASGEPLPSAAGGAVVARPVRGLGEARTSRIDPSGRFAVPGLQGAYMLGIDGLPDGWMLEAIDMSGTNVTNRPVELPGSGRFRATVTITSQVSGVTGSIPAQSSRDCAVVVFPTDTANTFYLSRFVRVVTPDRQGRFRITGLPPSPGYLIAAVDGFDAEELQDPELLQRIRAFASPISVGSGEMTAAGSLPVISAAAVLAIPQ